MLMDAHNHQMPYIDFPEVCVEAFESSSSWVPLCAKVREACEAHGFFLLRYDKVVSRTLCGDMLSAMRSLFDLPEETKSRYQNPRPYRSYTGKCPIVPLQESFGIDDPHKLDAARDFTELMWPEGNSGFCGTMHSMSSRMLELNSLIMKMLFDSFGMGGDDFKCHLQESSIILRLMKYRAPPPSSTGADQGGASAIGLVPHTDKNDLTILYPNDVQGLEITPKGGPDEEWVKVWVPEDAFIVIVGDALKAWSNGRLHAVKHRVVMSGDKDRYSCGIFSTPSVIRVPTKLVDVDHPLRYRPIKFDDFVTYYASERREDALEVYAGV